MLCGEKWISGVPGPYSYKHDYLERHLNDIKILALGHSHIADGIDMIALNDSGFNAAIPARHMYYDLRIASEFVPRMSSLRYVILPLGYNFQFRPLREINGEQKCNMAKYWGYNVPGEFVWFSGLELVHGSKYKVLELIGLKKKSGMAEQYDSLGHQILLPCHRSAQWEKLNLPLKNFRNKAAHKARSKFIGYIKEIAGICAHHGVKLIVVTMPAWKTYREATTDEGLADLYACVDSMRKCNPDLEYFNMIADSRFEADDFYDSSHLNDYGAKKFTSILKNDILTGE